MMRFMQFPSRFIARMTLAALWAAAAHGATVVNGRSTVVLETPAARLLIDLGGGSIVDFHLAEGGLNPLHWLAPNDEKVAFRPMAHFLCLDRWGPPSEAEGRNGMPYHGEASRVQWKETSGARNAAAMSAYLPMAGVEIERAVRLSETGAVFTVSETVTNRNKLGKIYNMVQHATIGPPFLDETTVVDSNATRGLMQSSPLPNPEDIEVHWPQALKQGRAVDLRHLTEDPEPNVVTFQLDGEMGWVIATNAAKELLLGYLFSTTDYPWLSFWRHVQNGKPLARGLEFGTTGMHQPFPILTAKLSIWGKPTFQFLDAGASATRRYMGFLAKVPPDFTGVARVNYGNGTIVIEERGGRNRQITVAAGK